MHYLITLGHQPEISLAELRVVCERYSVAWQLLQQDGRQALIDADPQFDPTQLMTILGGTVKIAERAPVDGVEPEHIAAALDAERPDGKIRFALHGRKGKAGVRVKKLLKEMGRNARFIDAKNAASIVHNNLVERGGDITVFDNALYITRAIQPFEEMAKRDYDRPATDSVSGMLPPKLARMLINLTGVDADATILDPFCGSGTILVEALDLGFRHVIGSDTSEKAIADTKKNVHWFSEQHEPIINTNACRVLQKDARELATELAPDSIDAIATEPYMGPPRSGRESRDALVQTTRALAPLYIDTFKALHTILTANATVIFIIPQFKYEKEWLTVDCVEQIKQLGFTLEPFDAAHSTLQYHRPEQHVMREIWRFRKQA